MQRFSAPTRNLLQDDGGNVEPNAYAEMLRQRASDLEDELQAIRSRTNTLSFPNRLPAELLSRIFATHAEAVAASWDVTKKLGWIKICHVCQHWRTVALGYAPLWSRITFAHPELVKLLLSRSKGALLDITIRTRQLGPFTYWQKYSIQECLEDIMSQVTRIRSVYLEISGNGPYRFKDVLSKASGCAPVLRELTLSDPNPPLRFAKIPLDFLQGGAPALRILRLEQVSIPWERLPLSATLTRLDLNLCFDRPSVPEFYQSLSKLKVLEDLHLANRWLPESGYLTIDSPTVSTPLTLPTLKTINVEDWIDVVGDFFNVIRLPNVVSTQVKLSDRLPRVALIDQCLRNMRTAIHDAIKEFPEVRRLRIQGFDLDPENVDDDPSFHMNFANPLGEAGNSHFSIVVRITDRAPNHVPIPDVLALVNKTFDFSTVTDLEFRECAIFPPTLFLETFSSLPKLQRLEFCATPIFTIFYNMGRDPALKTKARGGRRRPKPYFPALTSLCLSLTDFNEDGMEVEEIFDVIADAIGKRPKAHRIKCLQIKLCRKFGEEEFEQLSELLPKVDIEWDWYEDWEDTDDDSDDSSDLVVSV